MASSRVGKDGVRRSNIVPHFNGEIITRYDSEINGYFEAWATNYAEGTKPEAATIDSCLSQFKEMVKAAGLDIKVS